jgi:predicted porin
MNHSYTRPGAIATIALGLGALCGAMSAQAIDLTNGDWKFSFDGNVNVDYIYSNCESASSAKAISDVGGACVGSVGSSSVSSVANGLLPAAFTFGVATTQNGIDISVHLGLYPGIVANDGGSPNIRATPVGNTALGTTGMDVRQVYMTFGNKDMGTFTLGRQIGLFESDVILNDMTLLGVGGPGAAATPNPANTTLGGIGFGYIYTDWLAQMDYTTPDFSGANLTVGIFSPLQSLTGLGSGVFPGGTGVPKPAPGFHAKLAWKGTYGDTKVSLSATGIEQQQKYVTGTSSGSWQGIGGDVFAKIDYEGWSLMAGGYYAKGLGTTGLFIFGSDAKGNARDSYGYLVQGTYKTGPTKFGINYGVSRLAYADQADRTFDLSPANIALTGGPLVAANEKVTGGVYYDLTKNLMLLGEVSWVQDIAHANSVAADGSVGNSNTGVTGNVGVFLAF